MIKRIGFFGTILLLLAGIASAQGGAINGGPVFGPTGAPKSGATITICTSAGSTLGTCPGAANVNLATVYSDIGLTTPINQATNPLKTDGLGNWPATFAAPGSYYYTLSGAGITSPQGPYAITVSCIPGTTCVATSANNNFSGNNNSTGTWTFTNFNAVQWAGPGATPTIDQAVTACGANPCSIYISSSYTGPESASLVTNSVGYSVWTGASNITIADLRYNANLSAPIYGITFGSRISGQFNRFGASLYAHNATDSADSITGMTWLDGTLPSNGGGISGGIFGLVLHDTVTVGSSVTEPSALAAEVDANATSGDNPLYSVYGVVSGVNFTRVGAAQNILVAKAFGAKTCSNAIGAPAKMFYCYGFRGDNQTDGTYRNFSYDSQGDFLFENNTSIYAESVDATCTIAASPTGATESGQTVTLTLTAPCAAATPGQHIRITGVGVAGYNNDAIVLTGSGGTTLTYFAPGTANLAGSGSGTVQPFTPHLTTQFGNGNFILYKPLADTTGWKWENQAGTDLLQLDNVSFRAIESFLGTSTIGCITAGQCFAGAAGTELGGFYVLGNKPPTGRAGDTVCGTDASSNLECSYNNGTVLKIQQVVSTSFTTTAATTDNVTVTGMVSTGHCYLTPTNSGAAGGIASVFVSAKAANQITVTHTATAGWTFDVVCTPQ